MSALFVYIQKIYIFVATIKTVGFTGRQNQKYRVMNILEWYSIFEETTAYYHRMDDVNAVPDNPYQPMTIEFNLFRKNWIDAVQWHLEDIIRNPSIDPTEALVIKRRIDASNQDRTDMVEMIDSYFWESFKAIPPGPSATINTETPAWAIDRLSILALKVYHMQQEVSREGASVDHKTQCQKKLNILIEQKMDLTTAVQQLLDDISTGKKVMKLYKQMKMYNDPALNPVLYKK